MKITEQQTKIAYDIAKKVYQKKFNFREGQGQLIANGIGSGSAAHFINNFKFMIEGKEFNRTLNAFSLEYFLENIYNDFGTAKLSNALTALKLHIEYYERIQKGNNIKMNYGRKVYDKFIGTTPIETPDEREQNEISQELDNENKSMQDTIDYLKNLKENDPVLIKLKGKTYKRDNKTIVEIKKLRHFKCQICEIKIKKKDGNYYIEAAHIEPKYLKGRETPDNILILCPNHHKEFDHGNTLIDKPLDKNQVCFTMNGKPYKISLKIE